MREWKYSRKPARMRNRIRRMCALMMSLSLLAGLLSGCGSSGGAETNAGQSAESETGVTAEESAQEQTKAPEDGTESGQTQAEESSAGETEAQSGAAGEAKEGAEAREAGKYPIAWDLTKIYPTEEDWQKDYERALELVPDLEQYRGKLGTAEGLFAYEEALNEGELTKLMNRLYLYAYLGSQLNPSDKTCGDMLAKYSQLEQQQSSAVAYADEELYSLPMETRQKLLADPLLADYAYALRDLTDPDHVYYSEETNRVISTLLTAMGHAEEIHDVLTYTDETHSEIQMPDGTSQILTDSLYEEILDSGEYDREFKKKTCEQLYEDYKSYVHTYAALLEDCVRTYWAVTQVDGYETSRAGAMAAYDVEPEVYDLLIQAAHEALPEYQRYLKLHKEAMGLDRQYYFDVRQSVSDYQADAVAYDDAVDQVREALAVLGDDYLESFDEIITSPNQEVYPGDTTVGGAFSASQGDEFLPYMLFNYRGYNVKTIAHEMGHSIYSLWSGRSQKAVNEAPTIFTQEVASTTNELLYYNYKMEHAADDAEKLFYLEKMLFDFTSAYFTQVMYAEFEDYCYQTVEQGGTLDAEDISDFYEQLQKTYRGDAVEPIDGIRYDWVRIPHFYYDYYVYQYATSLSFAATIAQNILNGEPQALEAYKSFLKLGKSAPPSELLKTAGVDILDIKSYEQAMEYFSSLVDEYEELVGQKK